MLIEPDSPKALAALLAEAAARNQTISLFGRNSKSQMSGPTRLADVTLSTAALDRVLKYEPRDLTISVEAGLRYRDLRRVLARHRQMLPLDPPFAKDATIGGIVAANTSGPRRRLYGTARDMVIGMTFATLEGKLVETGGMVVKNVAGLDMGKLMIGSFGTLAAIAVVNFRVHPMPAGTRTFVRRFDTAADAAQARNAVLESVLQPMAVDLLKDEGEYALLIWAGGSKAVLDRYAQELPSAQVLEGVEEEWLWRQIREFTPDFLAAHEGGAVVRISSTLQESVRVIESLPEPAIARAGSGVCYGYFAEAEAALRWMRDSRAGKVVIEYAPALFRAREELWPEPGTEFPLMQKIKSMFDPHGLLNRGRLFGRI